MANVTFIWPGVSDLVPITASTQVATLPATNVQNQEPTKKWRTTVNNFGSLIFDFASPIFASALAIVGANWSTGANLRLRCANSIPALSSSPVYDSGVISPWNSGGKPSLVGVAHYTNLLLFSMGATPCRYWLVELGDGTPQTSYLEFGRVIIGSYNQPTINMDFAGGITFEQLDVQERTPYGQVFTDPRPYVPRRMDIQLSAADSDEVTLLWMNFSRYIGGGKDVIVSFDPSSPTNDFQSWTMQGVFSAPHSYSPIPLFNNGKTMWSTKFSILEKL